MKRLGDAFQGADAQNYERYRTKYPLKAIGRIFNEFGIKQGSTFADIGAGSGFLSVPLAGENLVYHVDASYKMNQMAHAKYAQFQGDFYKDRLLIKESDATQADIPARSVDVVTFGNSAHWFLGHQAALMQAKLDAICKPDAKVIIAFNIYKRDSGRDKEIFEAIEALFPESHSGETLTSGTSAAMMKRCVDEFIAPRNLKHFHEEHEAELSLNQFIGYVGTTSYGLKHGIDEMKQEGLIQIFNAYAEDTLQGKRLKLTDSVDFFCGDKAPNRHLGQHRI